MSVVMEEVGIGAKLNEFDRAIRKHEYLEIDGDVEIEGEELPVLKVLNHLRESAQGVTLDAIADQDIGALIHALETGVTTRLFGVTRIVGYYSRTSNWNKSKIAELGDRHRCSYKLGECKDI